MKHTISILALVGLALAGCSGPAPVQERTVALQAQDDKAVTAATPAGETSSFRIGLAQKDYTHPWFGIGHDDGFTLNGVQGGEIVLRRGHAYVFRVDSDPRHDFYLSSSDIGWGAGVINQGVKGNFTYSGEVTFTPGAGTQDVIYYQCQNHKAMGGRIFVVDAGARTGLNELHARYGAPGDLNLTARDATASVSAEDVAQKLSYAESVLASHPAQVLSGRAGSRASETLRDASNKIAQARMSHAAGADAEAMALTDAALRQLVSASQLVMADTRELESSRRFERQRQALRELRSIHAGSAQRIEKYQGRSAVVPYDSAEVERLQTQAAILVREGRHDEAIQALQQAQVLVNAAIGRMMAGAAPGLAQVDTPKEEYGFEVNRYIGYAELIPVALAEKDLSSKRERQFYGHMRQAQGLRDAARVHAEDKDFAAASASMQAAVGQQRLALRVLGIQGASEAVLISAVDQLLQAESGGSAADDMKPEARYLHDSGRFDIYARLAPVALTESEVYRERERLFHSYVEQADAKHRAASELAQRKIYHDAVRLMQEATGTLRRAILLVGVEQ